MFFRYYINGWTYGEYFFRSIGRFTAAEKELLLAGEVIEKNGDRFWVERVE